MVPLNSRAISFAFKSFVLTKISALSKFSHFLSLTQAPAVRFFNKLYVPRHYN